MPASVKVGCLPRVPCTTNAPKTEAIKTLPSNRLFKSPMISSSTRRGCQRRIERSGQTRRCPCGRGGPAILFDLSRHRGEVGAESSGQLHAGIFAAQTGPAADADNTSDEFDPDDAKRHVAKILPERHLELRNTAAERFPAK